jgi:glutamyl-tRNA synthetase
MPDFAHLPLILKPDGNGKLSKRSADKLGIPVYPLLWTDPKTGEVSRGFREEGYLPEALINFLALLGWNPGTEQELFGMEALISAFSLEKIGKAGARFDIEKAKWFNQQYLKEKPDSELAGDLLTDINNAGLECSGEKAEAICGLLKERVTFPGELLKQGMYFFKAPKSYDEKVVRKKWNDEAKTVLAGFVKEIGAISNFDRETVAENLNNVLDKEGIKIGRIMQALRLAVTGIGSGPDLMEIMAVIGREEVIERINNALARLG